MTFSAIALINNLFNILYIILLARIIISWFPARPGSIVMDIYEVLHSITEPFLAPLRRIIPPLPLGGGMLDLAPLILIFLLNLLRRFLLGMM